MKNPDYDTFSICFPFSEELTEDVQVDLKKSKEFLEEITYLENKIEFTQIDGKKYSPKIFVHENFREANFRHGWTADALIFEADLPFDGIDEIKLLDWEDLPIDRMEWLPLDRTSYLGAMSYLKFEKDVLGLLTLSQIAYPGSFTALRGVIVKNRRDNHATITEFSSVLNRYIIVSDALEWPKFRKVTIEQVLAWFNKYDYSWHRLSKNRTEAALFAFGHLFRNNNEDLAHSLFWSMFGLEAILDVTSTSVTKQIVDKLQLIHGFNKDISEVLKDLYNYRSRFVHGELSIPSSMISEQEHKVVNKRFTPQMEKNIILSSQILLTSFQDLILSDKAEFKFEWKLK